MHAEQNPGAGPLIGSIIVVLLLLLGGYYSLQTIPTPAEALPTEISDSQPVPIISAPIKPPQASTEIKDIEADAKEVDLASLDFGLENLDLLVK